jgi:spermidine/putrescine transport system permease protein
MAPFAIFAIVAALPRPGSDIWRAADELGGNGRATFLRVAIPLSVPGMIVGWSAIVALTLVSGSEVRYLEGPTQTSSQTILSSLVNVSVASAMAFSMLLMMFVVTFLSGALAVRNWWLRRSADYADTDLTTDAFDGNPNAGEGAFNSPVRVRTLARLQQPHDFFSLAIGKLGAGLGAFSLLSMGVVVVLSLTAQRAVLGTRWTLENFRIACHSATLLQAISSSIVVALVCGLFSLVLAMVLGFVWWRPGLRTGIILMTGLGVIMAPDAYAICLLQTIRLFGIEGGGLLLVTIAHVAWSLPFGLMFVLLSYRQTGASLLCAGFELSGGRISRVRSVVVSLNRPALLNCALTGFLLSLNEYTRASYLSGGSRTLSTEVFGRLESGFISGDNAIYAAATGIILLTTVVGMGVALCYIPTKYFRWRALGSARQR